MTALRFNREDYECLLLAVQFWLENVSQEDTDKETYLTLVTIRDTLELFI